MSTFDYKSLTKEELSSIFSSTLSFEIEPMWHQLVSLSFAADHERCCFFHSVGTGKTLLSLWTTQLWNSEKILVICPSSAFSAWERDISKYTSFSFDFLTGSGRERKAKLKRCKDIYIINYEGLKTIYCSLKKGFGWKIDYRTFIHSFDCLILDEVHKCKSYKSLQSKICYELSKRAKNVIGLTGTAIDSSLLEPFNIYKVVDLGKTLGNNFFMFRSKYFKQSLFDWKLKPKARDKILEKMAKSTISFDREECFDLPELQEVIREVEPSPEFLVLQTKLVTDEPIQVGSHTIDTENMKAKAAFLRELSGGFFYYKDKDKNRKVYRLKKNAKLEALVDLLEDMQGKVVIFFLFIEEGNMLLNELKKLGYKVCILRGGQSHEERKKEIERFTKKQDVRILLAQPSTASEGWDGSVANVVIFFDQMASPKTRKQTIGRIYRKGQTRNCVVFDLVLKHSIDTRVVKNRDKRIDFVRLTMEYIQEYGGVEEI